VKLDVNGASRSVEAHPDTPLLYVLRNHLGLAGTRFGCGSGECGACFVLVDGRAVASCDLPVGTVTGRKITTIEGLGGRHRVQKALVALLAADRKPTEAEVREALDRHLCRCGSHNRVVRAVMRAAHE
jgi:nicotinate dehydrogenase subunit A